MAEAQRRAPAEPPVSKTLTDRIRPDAEMVGQVLEPNRTPENVRFPDPASPHGSDEDVGGLDSIADAEMARRTDAGPVEPVPVGSPRSGVLIWVVGAAVLVILLLAIAMS
jgi:hypothetical protein